MPEPRPWDDFLDDDSDLPHGRLVSECFSSVTFDEAALLVGILSTHRIRLSEQLRAAALKAEMVELDDIEALEPQASATLIGKLFALDCDALYRQFHRQWKEARRSPIVGAVKEKLESHAHIGKLIRCSPLK
jgi:hypothetical protein